MVEEKELTRTFICVQMPDEVVKEIARVQEVLSGRKFTGKMTELENLHLTLKFLGEIDDEMLSKVRERLKGIFFSEFEAKISEIGTFAYRGMPRIVWVKIGGKGIFELQKKVDEVLEGLFKKEERFMSHVTVARVKYVSDREGFREYVRNIGLKEVSFRAGKFSFMKSEMGRIGPVYTELEGIDGAE